MPTVGVEESSLQTYSQVTAQVGWLVLGRLSP